MKFDVTKILTQLNGTDISIQNTDVKFCTECSKKWNEARQSLTLRLVCTQALTNMTQESQALAGEEKLKRGELARKIYNNDTVSLKPAEVSLLMELVGKVQGPLIVLQVYELLDPPEEK